MTVEKFNGMGEELLRYGGNSSQTATTMQQMQDFMVLQANTIKNLVDSLLWQPETSYVKGAVVYSPNIPAGYVAECESEAGQTGSNEPGWDINYEEYTDGTITWKMRKIGSGGGGGRNLGEILWLSAEDAEGIKGILKSDGAAISRTMYPDLNKLYASKGYPWGDGDGSTTFNLPNLIGKFAEGATDAGGYHSAGLPNIEGSFTVQPNSALLIPYVVVFTEQTTDSALIDVTQYAQDLANKVNRSEADYVVDSYHDDNGNWWRKYKSGWVEQGGIANDGETANFLKPFADVTYYIGGTTISGTGYASCSNRTNTTIRITSTSGSTINWYACGQGANV